MSELSDLLLSISSLGKDNVDNENIVSEDFDKLIFLMSQATTSLSTVVNFLETLVINPQSQSFYHFVVTPKNVSKRRRKKPLGPEESSFEESLQLQPLDKTNVENNPNRLSALAVARSPDEEFSRTSVLAQTEYPCPDYKLIETDPTESQLRTPLLCCQVSDCERKQTTLKFPTFKDDLFSEPISPIVSLHPSEKEELSVEHSRPYISNTISRTPANSTFDALCVSADNLNGRDPVEAFASKIKENRSTARVSFGEADYFYFQRCQGWNSVCKDGGNTLGMLAKHFHYQTRTLQETDSDRLQESNTCDLVVQKRERESLTDSRITTELECFSLNSSCDPLSIAESKKSQNNSLQESDYSLDSSKLGKKGELGTRGLERITPRKRRALLKSCSVQLDPQEAEELREIRVKRESVGCGCHGGKCEADKCSCAGEGIQCHRVCR